MSFLYPLFLIAGVTLVIPVLIHLFNLRKYKTVLFPHTRFLRNIQLNSRKQSQVKYKLLLATRLLFLACLILAFAQPIFNNSLKKTVANNLQIIYLDNSFSMSVKNGMRTVFDVAKESAMQQVRNAIPGAKFIILTNNKPENYYPILAEKAYQEINKTELSSASKTISQVLSVAQSILMQTQNTETADFYYYSDFQKCAFPSIPEITLLKQLNFYGIPIQTAQVSNIYFDSAFITTPVLQVGKNNNIIVHCVNTGKQSKENFVLQLSINGQVKSATSLSFNDKQISIDTLSFSVNDANWQKIELTVNDNSVKFDDTFLITARSTPNLSVLVLNEGQSNTFIQAAFRAYNGFRLNQADITTTTTNWKDYNLVILNGITKIDISLGKHIYDALLAGQSICIFPGMTNNYEAINIGLREVGDIHINSLDSSLQVVSSIQQGSNLVKELFEKIPENVQLPTVNRHYSFSAGLSANQQSVMSFRNGDPFLARYTPTKGQLYICASPADLQSGGNFPGSYFFTPFLYEMAMQAGSNSVYSLTSGKQQSVYIPLNGVTERNTVHVYNAGIDIIPPQRPNGAGLDVFIDQVVQQPGFYNLFAQGIDTVKVAINSDKAESKFNFRNISDLKAEWKGENIKWLKIADASGVKPNNVTNNFPVWKICVLLAIIMLAVETFLLIKPFAVNTGN